MSVSCDWSTITSMRCDDAGYSIVASGCRAVTHRHRKIVQALSTVEGLVAGRRAQRMLPSSKIPGTRGDSFYPGELFVRRSVYRYQTLLGLAVRVFAGPSMADLLRETSMERYSRLRTAFYQRPVVFCALRFSVLIDRPTLMGDVHADLLVGFGKQLDNRRSGAHDRSASLSYRLHIT